MTTACLILQLGAVIRSELDRDPQSTWDSHYYGLIVVVFPGAFGSCLLRGQRENNAVWRRSFIIERTRHSPFNFTEFLDQICPKPNSDERKYIRIKTFNDKYVWAEPKYWGEGSYLRTRCCGAKDATGRTDVTEPGRRTTFLIHCKRANNQNVFSFEILAKDKNTPSGYFFYADPNHYKIGLYARKLSSKAKHAHKFNFIIDRWRGPVVAIRTQGKAGTTKEQEKSMWLKFSDTGHGYVSGHNNLYRDPPGFPNFSDMFSLEAVPSGCVYGAAERDNVWAAPPGTSHEECESKPDRCYWTDGWKSGKMQPGKCYYNKDSKCHWHRTSSGIPLSRVCMLSNKLLLEPPAAECEAANCCFDYKRKQCYRQL
ncbi:uncharacterized protein LOC144639083 [Oculina patagonica]